jgi:hypothetical protein
VSSIGIFTGFDEKGARNPPEDVTIMRRASSSQERIVLASAASFASLGTKERKKNPNISD